jgi:glycosyltransferase involved in cell wall biosynthesis
MSGGYSSPALGSLACGQAKRATIDEAEAARLVRQFPGRLTVELYLNGTAPKVALVDDKQQPILPEPTPAPVDVSALPDHGGPEPYYGRDAGRGSDLLAEALASEAELKARTDAEYADLAGRLKRPMRVLHLQHYFGLGGAEWGIYTIASATDPKVCEHTVGAAQPVCELPAWFSAHGLRVDSPPDQHVRRAWFNELAKQHDLVDYTLPNTWETYQVPDCPVVATKVNCRYMETPPHLRGRLPGVVIGLSPAAAFHVGDAYPGIPRVVIPYGVTCGRRGVSQSGPKVRRDLGIPDDATVAVWCGRMHPPEKNLSLLKQAIEATPGLHWLVIGYFHASARAEEAKWREFLADHERVRWVQDANPWDMRRLYAAADFGVSTSDFEGLGISTQDAMAIGLPVVATDSGGSRFTVVSGATGYLTPQCDPEGLVDGVQAMADLAPAERRQLGDAGMLLAAARFDPAEVARRRCLEYAQLLPDLVTPPKVRRGTKPKLPMPEPARFKAARPAKVCIISIQPTAGGLMWRAAVTAYGLRQAGHDVSLLYTTPAPQDSQLAPWLDASGIPWRLMAPKEDLASAIEAIGPEVVQTSWSPLLGVHEGPWSICGWIAGPSVLPFLKEHKAETGLVNRWVVVSKAMMPTLPPDLAAKATVIRNACPHVLTGTLPRHEARAKLGLDRHDFAIVYAGLRLSQDSKGSQIAEQAVARLGGRAVLLACGNTTCQATVDRLAAAPNVRHLTGLRPWEMRDVMAAGDAFLQTSFSEGLSQAALEAASAGLPMVLTATGGTQELAEATGAALVPPGSVAATAEALAELRDDPQRRLLLASRTRAGALRDFGWQSYLRAYSDLYSELAEEARRVHS